MRGRKERRIGNVDPCAAKAEITDDDGKYENILSPQDGIDSNGNASMRAEVVPRGHG